MRSTAFSHEENTNPSSSSFPSSTASSSLSSYHGLSIPPPFRNTSSPIPLQRHVVSSHSINNNGSRGRFQPLDSDPGPRRRAANQTELAADDEDNHQHNKYFPLHKPYSDTESHNHIISRYGRGERSFDFGLEERERRERERFEERDREEDSQIETNFITSTTSSSSSSSSTVEGRSNSSTNLTNYQYSPSLQGHSRVSSSSRSSAYPPPPPLSTNSSTPPLSLSRPPIVPRSPVQLQQPMRAQSHSPLASINTEFHSSSSTFHRSHPVPPMNSLIRPLVSPLSHDQQSPPLSPQSPPLSPANQTLFHNKPVSQSKSVIPSVSSQPKLHSSSKDSDQTKESGQIQITNESYHASSSSLFHSLSNPSLSTSAGNNQRANSPSQLRYTPSHHHLQQQDHQQLQQSPKQLQLQQLQPSSHQLSSYQQHISPHSYHSHEDENSPPSHHTNNHHSNSLNRNSLPLPIRTRLQSSSFSLDYIWAETSKKLKRSRCGSSIQVRRILKMPPSTILLFICLLTAIIYLFIVLPASYLLPFIQIYDVLSPVQQEKRDILIDNLNPPRTRPVDTSPSTRMSDQSLVGTYSYFHAATNSLPLGYDIGRSYSFEEEDEALDRLLSQRTCDIDDLVCMIPSFPISPFNPSTSTSTSPSLNILTRSTSLQHRHIYLILTNIGFVDMTMNLICSGDSVGISRQYWLVVAADRKAFNFFILRGVPVVLMNNATMSTRGNIDSAVNLNAKDMNGIGSDDGIGSYSNPPINQNDWGSSTHININREKIPLIHTLLSHQVDVLLIDADMVILHSLAPLFKLPTTGNNDDYFPVDIQIMFDYPYGLIDLSSRDLKECDNVKNIGTAPCSYLWELNGGFFLLHSSTNTIKLLSDMMEWLKLNPSDHDQEALRQVLKSRYLHHKLRFMRDDGTLWPSLASGTPDNRLSLRYIDPLLAPNGGLFFLEGSSIYKEEASRRNIAEPIVIHVNWMVGYERKKQMITKFGLWYLEDRGARCTSIASIRKRRKQILSANSETNKENNKEDQEDENILHRNTIYPRLTPLVTTLAVTSASADNNADVSLGVSDFKADGTKEAHIVYPYQPAPPLLLLFSSPKPTSLFTHLPHYISGDRDGIGEVGGVENMTASEIADLKNSNSEQLRAQILTLRSWFLLSDGRDNLVETLLFSSDLGHWLLAEQFSFDLIDRFGTDEFGAPKLHSIFQQAEIVSKRRQIPYMMYTNGDIIFQLDLQDTLIALDSYQFPELLAVGSRSSLSPSLLGLLGEEYEAEMKQFVLDMEVDPLTFLPASSRTIHDRLQKVNKASFSRISSAELFQALAAKSHQFENSEALDFFLFSRDLWDWQQVPHFLLGRIAYDNWLLHWANSRRTTTVVDVSDTVTAVHINHDRTPYGSHLAPNGMVNLRLAGQTSRRGLGKLDNCAWQTRRLKTGEIQVVRKRPESGHVRNLYDAATDAFFLFHGHPTLIVITVDNAFIPVFKNWVLLIRKCRGTSEGVLLLSAGPEASEVGRQQGIPVFELAQGEKANAALNGQPPSYLQIISLRSRAILYLLEFGYDVFNSHCDEVWMKDPFVIMSEKIGVVSNKGSREEDEERVSSVSAGIEIKTLLEDETTSTIAPPQTEAVAMEKIFSRRQNSNRRSRFDLTNKQVLSSSGSNATPSKPSPFSDIVLSTGDSVWWVGAGIDLIGFEWDSKAYNLSAGALFIRHTPESLRMWRRISTQYGALVTRATMAYQVNLMNLYEDWYVQYELEENEQLKWARIKANDNVEMRRIKSFKEYRQGVLIDVEGVANRLKDAGLWLLEKGYDQHFTKSPISTMSTPMRKLTDYNTIQPDRLTDEEYNLLIKTATQTDDRRLGLLSLNVDNSPLVVKWLQRANSLKIKHFVVIVDSLALEEKLLPESLRGLFPSLYSTSPSISTANSLSFLSLRILQLLNEGFFLLLIDPDSVWFQQPFTVLHKQSAIETSERFNCDVSGYLNKNGGGLDIESRFLAITPSPSTRVLWTLIHQCWEKEITPKRSIEDEDSTVLSKSPTLSLPLHCLHSHATQLRNEGFLSVCSLDPYYFPSARAVFETGEAVDSGVWPIISPGRFIGSESGRVKEFVEGWNNWANKEPLIQPPIKTNIEESLSIDITQSNELGSRCPPRSDGRIDSFTLRIRLLTYSRVSSLERLLRSLNEADYGTDKIELEISVDRPPSDLIRESATSYEKISIARGNVIDLVQRFEWKHGKINIIILQSHEGLVGQWLHAWKPSPNDDSTLLLVLEDDLELSPLYYTWLKSCVCNYYLDEREFDPHLYGISLQNQEYVVGQSIKNQELVNQAKAAAMAAAAAVEEGERTSEGQTEEEDSLGNSNNSASTGTPSSATRSAIRFSVSTIFDLPNRIGPSPIYRYQLVGTWGLLLFPSHWRAFMSWYEEKQSQTSSFNPCVPFLESSVWWANRPHAVWSQWLIRYTFEKGWYCLYANWNKFDINTGKGLVYDNSLSVSLAVNHREIGENYMKFQGPSHRLLRQADMSAYFPTLLPPLNTTPLFDFHFSKIEVNGVGLGERHLLLTNRHWKKACLPYKPPTPPSNYLGDRQ